MPRKVFELVVVMLLLTSIIFNACTTVSNFKMVKFRNQFDRDQLPGEYHRANLDDTHERLVLRENATYEWTQIVLLMDYPGWYSHTGTWEIKGTKIVLSPKGRFSDVFKSSLQYVMLNIDGKNVLIQTVSLRYVGSPRPDRFFYIKDVSGKGILPSVKERLEIRE